MLLGDRLIWKGRVFVVRGFEPMSLPEARVELKDIRTGEHVHVPVAELERAASRVAPTGSPGSRNEPA
ncbi:MAG: hypothetical protein KGJ43_03190 [Acidobacteriota bacterium]|nr:hypothetical protein [Acidobacteriota bacterium]